MKSLSGSAQALFLQTRYCWLTQLVRLLSNCLKVVRNFKLAGELRTVERIAGELGQLRRLLRVDRLCMVIRDYFGSMRKERLSGLDYFMLLFRALLLFEDCSDALAFLVQLGVLRGGPGRLALLRRRVADLYFVECLGWLLYHSYEWWGSKPEEGGRRSRMVVARYLLDATTSHNDFSGRRTELSGKTVSILGLMSSLINLYLIWK
jgi:hypothetical protein